MASSTKQVRVSATRLKEVRCGLNHAAPRTLTPIQGSTMVECDGCGAFWTAEQVINAQPGEYGSGGVILR